ncbi:hypothetical protein ACIPJS_27495 [Streptomyces sp. NPDC086783]|uniref:hypothetical protein n=1 Tax=Streptomyces sp. NPDC086783 TaxID=3365758 RepID=UPI00380B3037
MPAPETASQSAPAPRPPAPPPQDTASDVVRWAAFSCVLVPVVLVLYGTSLAGAAGTALGLGAVTAACRMLLRQSERGAARLRAQEERQHRGRHGRPGPPQGGGPGRSEWGRGGAHAMAGGHAGRGGSHGAAGAHGRNGPGARRGGRRTGGDTPVD